jgi:hypothetical protein
MFSLFGKHPRSSQALDAASMIDGTAIVQLQVIMFDQEVRVLGRPCFAGPLAGRSAGAMPCGESGNMSGILGKGTMKIIAIR